MQCGEWPTAFVLLKILAAVRLCLSVGDCVLVYTTHEFAQGALRFIERAQRQVVVGPVLDE